MFRFNNGQLKKVPPTKVVFEGFVRKFNDLSREEWDELGYNEACPITRAPYTTYETTWAKGEDLIYREEIMSKEVDNDTLFETLMRAKQTEIRDKAQTFLDDVAQREYPQWEVETWKDQENEAIEFLNDNTVETPTLDGICTGRNIDKETLANNIITNANTWRPIAAYVIGQRLQYHDELRRAVEPEDIEIIEVEYALPS